MRRYTPQQLQGSALLVLTGDEDYYLDSRKKPSKPVYLNEWGLNRSLVPSPFPGSGLPTPYTPFPLFAARVQLLLKYSVQLCVCYAVNKVSHWILRQATAHVKTHVNLAPIVIETGGPARRSSPLHAGRSDMRGLSVSLIRLSPLSIRQSYLQSEATRFTLRVHRVTRISLQSRPCKCRFRRFQKMGGLPHLPTAYATQIPGLPIHIDSLTV